MRHYLIALLLLALVACSSPAPSASASITGVSIASNPGQLSAGQTLALSASVQGKGKFDPTVAWSSSDVCKAKVDANGVVTGISGGGISVIITATSRADSSKKASIALTVEGPVSVPLGPGGGC